MCAALSASSRWSPLQASTWPRADRVTTALAAIEPRNAALRICARHCSTSRKCICSVLRQTSRCSCSWTRSVPRESRTKVANLRKLGIPPDKAYQWGNSRRGHWRMAGSPALTRSVTNERLAAAGFFSILNYYESLHLCGRTAVYRSVRTVVWEVGSLLRRASYSIFMPAGRGPAGISPTSHIVHSLGTLWERHGSLLGTLGPYNRQTSGRDCSKNNLEAWDYVL